LSANILSKDNLAKLQELVDQQSSINESDNGKSSIDGLSNSKDSETMSKKPHSDATTPIDSPVSSPKKKKKAKKRSKEHHSSEKNFNFKENTEAQEESSQQSKDDRGKRRDKSESESNILIKDYSPADKKTDYVVKEPSEAGQSQKTLIQTPGQSVRHLKAAQYKIVLHPEEASLPSKVVADSQKPRERDTSIEGESIHDLMQQALVSEPDKKQSKRRRLQKMQLAKADDIAGVGDDGLQDRPPTATSLLEVAKTSGDQAGDKESTQYLIAADHQSSKKTHMEPKTSKGSHQAARNQKKLDLGRLPIKTFDSIEERSDEESQRDGSQTSREDLTRGLADQGGLLDTGDSFKFGSREVSHNQVQVRLSEDPPTPPNNDQKMTLTRSPQKTTIESINVMKSKIDLKARIDSRKISGIPDHKKDPTLTLQGEDKLERVPDLINTAPTYGDNFEDRILNFSRTKSLIRDDGTEGGSSQSTPRDTLRSLVPVSKPQKEFSMREFGESLSLTVKPLNKPTYRAETEPKQLVQTQKRIEESYTNPFKTASYNSDFDSLQKLIQSNLELSNKTKVIKPKDQTSKRSTSPTKGFESRTNKEPISKFNNSTMPQTVLKQAGKTIMNTETSTNLQTKDIDIDPKVHAMEKERIEKEIALKRKKEIEVILERSKHTMQEDIVDEILETAPPKEVIAKMRARNR
jgi:hypothetical protein